MWQKVKKQTMTSERKIFITSEDEQKKNSFFYTKTIDTVTEEKTKTPLQCRDKSIQIGFIWTVKLV
jgi:hypothetical protein